MAGRLTAIQHNRRIYLAVTIGVNLLLLAFFKYYAFFRNGVAGVSLEGGRNSILDFADVVLPLGISFYTFQLCAYVVDVYRRQIQPEKSFGMVLLFVSYFPQLIAGPIERGGRLLPLLKSPEPLTPELKLSSLGVVGRGLFKKVFVADNIAPFVNLMLQTGAEPPAPGHILTAAVLAVQVYADFSGYTDIARGVSQLLGVRLSENFRNPLFASNPVEFWRRWHITLGAFFRDYVYIPLGGSRQGRFRHLVNLLIVFLLGGIWHGAGSSFLAWGFYCGSLVILYLLIKPLLLRVSVLSSWSSALMRIVGAALTFLSFGVGLLSFKVDSINELKLLLTALFPFGSGAEPLAIDIALRLIYFILPLIVIEVVESVNWKRSLWKSAVGQALFATGVVLFIVSGSFQMERFFYFQF